jgi:hypothetical protein
VLIVAIYFYYYFRRESERRNHSLARHADILAAVETRLSLLNMTFMKYVDSNLCCFIPGKVKWICLSKTTGVSHANFKLLETYEVVFTMLALSMLLNELLRMGMFSFVQLP